MASGRLIERTCLAAGGIASLAAITLHVALRLPAPRGEQAQSLAGSYLGAMAIGLHAAVVVALALLIWAGIASLRRPGGTLAAPLTAALVVFLAYVGGLWAWINAGLAASH